jgi:hypothetical protein
VDPRSGLADMTVTCTTLLALFESYARGPEYAGLQSVIDCLKPVVKRLTMSAQELSDCLALLPVSMDYHARRAALWTMQQPDVARAQRTLEDSSESLRALRP